MKHLRYTRELERQRATRASCRITKRKRQLKIGRVKGGHCPSLIAGFGAIRPPRGRRARGKRRTADKSYKNRPGRRKRRRRPGARGLYLGMETLKNKRQRRAQPDDLCGAARAAGRADSPDYRMALLDIEVSPRGRRTI
ncbi:hypothetical protein EVAR_68118_1 [Eumeta japonica]|uniref:Uncharacterized protein n=1 Tax=Eumeta variegata TaxID=151549 RepID=A0A4C1ZH37_EUMVA|nr:hypothetical protein EVAR_68118_1 [Eumeta japonica]